MKLALIHDHLTQHGGAENLLLSLQEIWPKAPTYTLIYDTKRAHQDFRGKDIRTSWLQKLPFAKKHYQTYLPLMPSATESYDLREFDIVVSSASALAKGIITGAKTLHICYCHTPTRYLWSDTHTYVRELRYPWIVKKIIPRTLTRLRMWDKLAADRVDVFIANSEIVRQRIKKYYKHESEVIYPPVDIEKLSPDYINDFSYMAEDRGASVPFFLIGGRLVYYKRFDIAIRAFNKLGISLKVFGTGPEFLRLKKIAKGNIVFLGQVSEEEKIKLYQRCTAFLHPHEEDFGITAVEAMACGRPVVAYRAGGAMETIKEGVTGMFFDDQDWAALADTVIRTDFTQFDPKEISDHAQKFSKERFKREMEEFVISAYNRFQKGQSKVKSEK